MMKRAHQIYFAELTVEALLADWACACVPQPVSVDEVECADVERIKMAIRNGSEITTVFSVPLTLPSPQRGEGNEDVVLESFPRWLSWRGILASLFLIVLLTRLAVAQSTTIVGDVVDFAESGTDGSVRFHVIESSNGQRVDVADIVHETASLLLEDAFEETRSRRWRDSIGTTRVENGKLLANDDRTLTVLDDCTERDARVTVTGKLDAEIGIVVHFRDPQHYVLAFVTPAFHLTGYHEVVNGNFGPWIEPVSTSTLFGPDVRMTVEVRGNRITTSLEDGHGHRVHTRCRLSQCTEAGAVGLYYDRSSAHSQHFDDFRAERLCREIPEDAVEVVIPASAAGSDSVWSIGSHVRAQGTVAPAGAEHRRRTLTVARVSDIQTLASSGLSLFPKHIPGGRFLRFPAAGFRTGPACGVIYRREDTVTNGMPLGGIDTGCFDLETSGMLGYMTIFNTHVPRRGPVNVPLLGLSVGDRTWVLCDPQPKDGQGQYQPSVTGRSATVWRDGAYQPGTSLLTPVPTDMKFDGVSTADEIHYWGHYPVADLQFDTDASIQVALRAWSPFLPGDVVGSMLPGAMFEVHLNNLSADRQTGSIAISFPGPLPEEAGSGQFVRATVDGIVRGVEVSAPKASYLLGAVAAPQARLGGSLGVDGAAWKCIGQQLPAAKTADAGTSVAVDFQLGPQQSQVIRFVLAWHAPTWNAGGYNWAGASHEFTHMYALDYSSVRQAAEILAREHATLLSRVLAWQNEIYTDQSLPVWLRESLVNVLHLITETGLWAQARPPLPTWVRSEDGLFGMIECPRGCPQIECIPCSFYGNQPLVYFFPQLALSTLRGYKSYQFQDGAPPWIFGGCTCGTPPIDFANPARGYQYASNGISLAAMIDRYLLCYGTEDAQFIREFYPVLKRATIWTVELRNSPDYTIGERVISMPRAEDTDENAKPPTEWFEAPEPGWRGMTAHIGGLHLAQLRITQRMARLAGDESFARQCAKWIEAGARSMDERLWTGRYYRNYLEPETQRQSDLIFGYQLDGEWITDHHGLPTRTSCRSRRDNTRYYPARKRSCHSFWRRQLCQSGWSTGDCGWLRHLFVFSARGTHAGDDLYVQRPTRFRIGTGTARLAQCRLYARLYVGYAEYHGRGC